jgi:dihydrofolate reductase
LWKHELGRTPNSLCSRDSCEKSSPALSGSNWHFIARRPAAFQAHDHGLPGADGPQDLRLHRQAAARIEEAPSFEAALELLKHATKVYVIGGAQVYAEALPWADELVLTEIDHDFEGDTYFPEWDRSAYAVVSRETHTSPEGWDYHFVTYHRRPPPVPDEP